MLIESNGVFNLLTSVESSHRSTFVKKQFINAPIPIKSEYMEFVVYSITLF